MVIDRKTKQEIEIDFLRAINQAEELENIADSLSQIANLHVDNAVKVLKKGWKGENANEYIKRGGELTDDIYETAENLLKIAKSIRTTADIVYKAEKAAANCCLM